MNILGLEIPFNVKKHHQHWIDERGIFHIEYKSRADARKDRIALIRAKIRRVSNVTEIKGEGLFEITIPHPNWTIENPLDITECTPKKATGPKDSLAKHIFGDIIKPEKTEEQLLKQEKRYKKNKNLSPAEIEDRTFIHKAVVNPDLGPSRQISLGRLPDMQEERVVSETPWLQLPKIHTEAELFELFIKLYPEYKR